MDIRTPANDTFCRAFLGLYFAYVFFNENESRRLFFVGWNGEAIFFQISTQVGTNMSKNGLDYS